jgi:hypothetical protein
MLARPSFSPAKYEGKGDKGRADGAYDEDDMSRHDKLFSHLTSALRSDPALAATLIQINLPNCARDGIAPR